VDTRSKLEHNSRTQAQDRLEHKKITYVAAEHRTEQPQEIVKKRKPTEAHPTWGEGAEEAAP
jgi:hypothetical protein